MQASFGVGEDGIRVFEYGSGSAEGFALEAEFDTGSFDGLILTDSSSDNDHELRIADNSPWWDEAWEKRQCYEVEHTAAEYPFRVFLDTSDAATDDIRVVEITGATQTIVPHYTEWRDDPANTTIWFRATNTSSGTYCVYFDNPGNPGSTSDEFAPFTYVTGQTVTYYALFDATQVRLYSYVDNNTVTVDGAVVVLNEGQWANFPMNRHTVITATGPIEASGVGVNTDTFVPEGYADTQFTFPSNRSTQIYYLRSVAGPTTVTAYHNGVAQGAIVIDGNATTRWDPPGDGGYLTLESDDGTPFVAMHTGNGNSDIFPGVPWRNEPVYGVPSRDRLAGAPTAMAVNWRNSNGANGGFNLNPGVLSSFFAAGSTRGRGPAYEVTGFERFAVAQQADADGLDATAFLPLGLLARTFILPVGSNYVTFACPRPGTIITIAGQDRACNGNGIGKYLHDPNLGAGTRIEADFPVYAYFEEAQDEQNILGGKSSIPHDPTATVGLHGACGTWTSPVIDTVGVFGVTTLESGGVGDITFHLSFDGGPFVGPDGTENTSYEHQGIIDYVHDDATTTAQIRVEICDGAFVETIGFEHDLEEIALDPVNVPYHPVEVSSNGPVLRIYPDHDITAVYHRDILGAPATYDIGTDLTTAQIGVVAGVVTPTPVDFASQPFSVTLENGIPQTAAHLIEIRSETAANTLQSNVGVRLIIGIPLP